MQEFDPDDHVHRFPAALASHTSFNPYTEKPHEPTEPDYSYTLPPGVQYAALDIMPEDWENKSLWEQRFEVGWKPIRKESALRYCSGDVHSGRIKPQ